jgi:hypothetical protein
VRLVRAQIAALNRPERPLSGGLLLAGIANLEFQGPCSDPSPKWRCSNHAQQVTNQRAQFSSRWCLVWGREMGHNCQLCFKLPRLLPCVAPGPLIRPTEWCAPCMRGGWDPRHLIGVWGLLLEDQGSLVYTKHILLCTSRFPACVDVKVEELGGGPKAYVDHTLCQGPVFGKI